MDRQSETKDEEERQGEKTLEGNGRVNTGVATRPSVVCYSHRQMRACIHAIRFVGCGFYYPLSCCGCNVGQWKSCHYPVSSKLFLFYCHRNTGMRRPTIRRMKQQANHREDWWLLGYRSEKTMAAFMHLSIKINHNRCYTILERLHWRASFHVVKSWYFGVQLIECIFISYRSKCPETCY